MSMQDSNRRAVQIGAGNSPFIRLMGKVYGDVGDVPSEELQSRPFGLYSRIWMLAQRMEALAMVEQELGQMPPSTGLDRYMQWLHQELDAAAKGTGVVQAISIVNMPNVVRLHSSNTGPDGVAVEVADDMEVARLKESPRFWECDALYEISDAGKFNAEIELGEFIAGAIPVNADAPPTLQSCYDRGYRDAMESLMLAASKTGVNLATCKELTQTALDAFANDAPEFENDEDEPSSPRPG